MHNSGIMLYQWSVLLTEAMLTYMGWGLLLGFILVFMAYVILEAMLMSLACAATEGYVLWFSREQC